MEDTYLSSIYLHKKRTYGINLCPLRFYTTVGVVAVVAVVVAVVVASGSRWVEVGW